jgi:hypothetical protein
MSFQFQETWTLKLESPKLRDAIFSAGLRVAGTLDSLQLD